MLVMKQRFTWFSQQCQFYNKKIKKFGETWVVDAEDIQFIEMFLFCHAYLNIQHCFFSFLG